MRIWKGKRVRRISLFRLRKAGKTWMELCFERMFHDVLKTTAESSAPGNKVPIILESIAKNGKSGYNFRKSTNERHETFVPKSEVTL